MSNTIHPPIKMAIATTITLIFATLILTAQAQCPKDGTKCQFTDCGTGEGLQNCLPLGFAGRVTGGADLGRLYSVSNPSDDPTNSTFGSLRYLADVAALSPYGGWIVFGSDMEIELKAELSIGSNVAIDGRDHKIKISGYPIVVMGSRNVVLENLEIGGSSDHSVLVSGSSQVLLDHLTVKGGNMGVVVGNGSTDVTISNCEFSKFEQSLIVGDSNDREMRVTVYRNFFDRCTKDMPYCRSGYCHVVNNYYKDWVKYGMGGSGNASIYSEMNVFDPMKGALQVTPWFQGFNNDTSPAMESHGDAFLNGAKLTWFKHPPLQKPPYKTISSYPPLEPTGTLPGMLENCAGALHGARLDACSKTL